MHSLGMIHDVGKHLIVGQLLQRRGGAEDGLHERRGNLALLQLSGHPLSHLQGLAPGAVGSGQDFHPIVVIHVHDAGRGDLNLLVLRAEDIQLRAPVRHRIGAEGHHFNKVKIVGLIEIDHRLSQRPGILIIFTDVHPHAGRHAVRLLTIENCPDAFFSRHVSPPAS